MSGEIRVLIVDDDYYMRQALLALLWKESGMKVVGVASCPEELIYLVSTGDIQKEADVVLLGMKYIGDEMKGINAIEEIHGEVPGAKVVILSMYSTREYIYRALEAGAIGYVLKESASTEIIQAVYTVHDGRKYLSARISETFIDDYIHNGADKFLSNPIRKLSAREREILQLVVEGKSSAAIADKLFLSPKTIETYRSRLMQKLGIKDIPGLVKFAIKHGLTTLDD